MSKKLTHLPAEEQRLLFEKRGLFFPEEDHERDANKIQEIGYYKLKEFAYPFATYCDNGEIQYKDLNFKSLLIRYYQDKNLRIFLLHAIEDIEVHLSNSVATLLGKKYGPFGYLMFNNWCNRSINKFKIEEKQYYFKRDLLKKVERSRIPDLRLEENKDADGFPSVWLMVNTLMFGDTLHLVMIMSSKNKNELAKMYDCTAKELVSWLKCLHFIRNVCAHNSNLIDLHLGTQPEIPQRYADKIFQTDSGYSNSLAIVFFVAKILMDRVNPKYKFGNIYDSFYKIIDHRDDRAISLGFKTQYSILAFKNYRSKSRRSKR